MSTTLRNLTWVLLWAGLMGAATGCSRLTCTPTTPADDASNPGSGETRAQPSFALFTEITEAVGLRFVHDAGFDPQHPEYFMPESMAPGAAMFDYDGDGDLDIYLVNGAHTYDPKPGTKPPRNRLLRNDGPDGFVDVTDPSGLGDTGWGMGVAVGDIDNDGDEDVYLTNYGPDALYRNNGDGTFEDVTKVAGIDNPKWAASAAFFDYDRDGYLDLFVTNYLAYDPSVKGRDRAGRPEYTGPHLFAALDDVLYHNNGDGTFTDVSAEAKISEMPGRGLGLACADFNDDGWPDVYVANDREANRLWMNQGDGTFEDDALLAGVALNSFGLPEASMGVAVGDVDGDGDLDLFMTHLFVESNTLYQNEGGGVFEDRTVRCGLSAASIDYTGFGTAFLDYDHDGDLDLVVVNGRVRRDAPFQGAGSADHWKVYKEPNLLFENDGLGIFRDVSAQAGTLCSYVEVSRGLVSGDIDNDGDLDLLITNGGGSARLFRNDAPKKGNWLVVRALDPALNRDANGAQIVVRANGHRYRRDINRGFSYLCSGDPRAHFGLGGAGHVDGIEVRWPDGTLEFFPKTETNQILQLSRGTGQWRPE
ncbi:MAG: CRTAC1 family protein [Planctomycetes bacterium]|nr:CRTAC1 family protein [Planctomycetota bacterium]